MNINVINKSKHQLPNYETEKSAGMDLRANIDQDIVIMPFERILINTGLYIELPNGYEGQIRPRSGIALKHGITVLNSPGTVDADYRGEIKILLINLSNLPFTIKDGDRVAQLVISNYARITWQTTEKLSDTARNNSGYGSTGVK